MVKMTAPIRTHSAAAGTSVVRELRHHLRVMQHRPGDQVRKVGHEQRIVHETWFACLVLIDVDEIGDLREREERNAERQHDVQGSVTRARDGIQAADQEISVFEVGEQNQIGSNRTCQPYTPPSARRACDRKSHRVVEYDGPEQQRDVSPSTTRRRQGKPVSAKSRRAPCCDARARRSRPASAGGRRAGSRRN